MSYRVIPEATYYLAKCYEDGIGVHVNNIKAFTLYTEASFHNDPFALDSLLRCIYWGIGCKKNRNLYKLIEILYGRALI